MKLERIEVKNYRSLFHDYDAKESFVLDLADGMNAVTGPNNVGKSNVLRALSLALDPDFEFDRVVDMPALWNWSKPSVTLTFRVPQRGRAAREATLLKLVNEYERKLNPSVKRTYAEDGEIRLRVTIEGSEDSAGTRRQVFVAKGVGARSLTDDDPVAKKALDSFHRCIHFVLIESGQSLESLMEGRFRDILHNVLREDLRSEVEAAGKVRQAYSNDLQTGLLKRLSDRIREEVGEMFQEISDVELVPQVPSLEETLAKMRVRVSDLAITDLSDKGTGVRGGLIVAMLRHFAEVGKRSMVFAVEEPESFLHPAAQEGLREDLEALAKRPDISLLVTTHSPHIVSRQPNARVFGLDKDSEGRTIVREQADGDAPQASVLGGLYRDRLVMEYLDRCEDLAGGAALYLVVEGSTDRDYLRLALERAGRSELLQGIEFRLAGSQQGGAGGGASMAIMQALVTNAASPVPVAVLLDNDEPGRMAANQLSQIGQSVNLWKKGKTLLNYSCVFPANLKGFEFEAEDLWPPLLLEEFLAAHPEADRGKKPYPANLGGFQHHVDAKAKGDLLEFLRLRVTAEDCTRWVALAEQIRKGAGMAPPQEPSEGMGDPVVAGDLTTVRDQAAPAEDRAERELTPSQRRRKDRLDEVMLLSRASIVGAGLRPQRTHAHGAYAKVELDPSLGLSPRSHLLVRVGQREASVTLVVEGYGGRAENLAMVKDLERRVGSRVRQLATAPEAWRSGQVGSRAVVPSRFERGGYLNGDPTETAAWVSEMCRDWVEVLDATDLEADDGLSG